MDDLSAFHAQLRQWAAWLRVEEVEVVARQRPQDTLDALLEIQGESARISDQCWACMPYLRQSVAMLQLDGLWSTLLQQLDKGREIDTSSAVSAMLVDHVVPRDVAEQATQRKDVIGWTLRLLSDAEHSRAALEFVLFDVSVTGLIRLGLMPSMAIAVRRHSIDVMSLLRESFAEQHGVAEVAELVRLSGTRFKNEEQFSAADLEEVCSDRRVLLQLAPCFDCRPERLIGECLRRTRADPSMAARYLDAVARFLTAKELEAVIADASVAADKGSFEALAWVVARPVAPVKARAACLSKWRTSNKGLVMAVHHLEPDWKAFSDTELRQFAFFFQYEDLLLRESFARELIRRNLINAFFWAAIIGVAETEVRKRPSTHGPNTIPVGLCHYALYDCSKFAKLVPGKRYDAVSLSDRYDSVEDRTRDMVYALVRRWSQRYHPFLPVRVQQIALVSLWILTPRVGTRHLVYVILEQALQCRLPPVRSMVSLSEWYDLLELMCGKANLEDSSGESDSEKASLEEEEESGSDSDDDSSSSF